MPKHPHAFPAEHRLSGRLRFSAVFDAKVKKSAGPLTGFSFPNDRGHPRLGLSVSRRLGNAVRRNRIKRMIREAFRLRECEGVLAIDLVVVVRPHVPGKLDEYRSWVEKILIGSGAAWEKKPGSKGDR